MIAISSISIVNLFSPKIVFENGANYFVTGETSNHHKANGLKILPCVTQIPCDGILCISQFVLNHKLDISTFSTDKILFDSKGEIFKDATSASNTYNKTYHIKNGLIYNDPFETEEVQSFFHDAPFLKLCSDWKSVLYDIEFQTEFSYLKNKDSNCISHLAKFKWKIDCSLEHKDGQWEVVKNGSSSECDIKSTFDNSLPAIDFICNSRKHKLIHTAVACILQQYPCS